MTRQTYAAKRVEPRRARSDVPIARSATGAHAPGSVAQVLWLQRWAGNRAAVAYVQRQTPNVVRAQKDEDTAAVIWRDDDGGIVAVLEFESNRALDAYIDGSQTVDQLVAADRARWSELSVSTKLPKPSAPAAAPPAPEPAPRDSSSVIDTIQTIIKVLRGIFGKFRTGRNVLFLVAKDAQKARAAANAQLRLLRREAASLKNRIEKSGGGRKVAERLAQTEAEIARIQAEIAAERAALREANALVQAEQRAATRLFRRIWQLAGGVGVARKEGFSLRLWQKAWKRAGPIVNRLLGFLAGAKGTTKLLAVARKLQAPWISRSLVGLAAALEGINGYLTSHNQTTGGKVAEGVLAGAGGAMVAFNPITALADVALPKGYKLSEVYSGGAGAISSLGEGLITGDTRGMEGFHEASKRGEYGKVMQLSSEAGDYWADHGVIGGLKDFGSALRDLF